MINSIDSKKNFQYSIPVEDITKNVEGTNTYENEHYDFLDKIDECAVIVQRGILKQINNPFSNLTGFDSDEMIEKSFFDYVAPEGFSEVEDYYLNRLKGEDVSSCETIILTRDNEKIPVKINVKTIYYQGERAEIFIIKNIQDKKQDFQ